MDKLSDYIPLIIIVGSIVYSIVKGLGKSQKEETAKTTLPKPHSQPEIKRKTPIKEPEFKIQEPVVVTKTPSLSQPPVVFSESREAESATVPFLDTNDLDEVKKAFIYTEIFNQKY